MQKIAVIGSTGMLGQPVTKELLSAGFDVTLFVRDTGKAKAVFGATVKMVKGDLSDPESIRLLLEGQDAVYLNLSVAQTSKVTDFQPEREGLANLLGAANAAGLKRIAYLSSLVQRYQGLNGFRWWVFDIKHQAVEQIKASGIPYTIFYPSTFMESFDKGAYRQRKALALAGRSKHKLFLIAGRDYGQQVAKALRTDSGNREYVVQGTEGFTADEAAAFYVRHYTREKVRIWRAPLGLLRFLGKFSTKMNYGAHIIEALNNYPEQLEAQATWAALGKPPTTFANYIQRS